MAGEMCRLTVTIFCLGLLLTTLAIEDERDLQASAHVQTFDRDAVVARTIRSTSTNTTCSSDAKAVDFMLNASNRSIQCNCSADAGLNIIWQDQNCQRITSDESVSVNKFNKTLIVIKGQNKDWIVFCSNGKGCIYKITVLETVQPVQGLSTAVQGLFVFLVVAIVVALSFIIFKKYRLHIYLCCRDTCSSSNTTDGKEFDAYISVGKNTSDLKFINRNITEVLQKKYNYSVIVDEENLLPRLEPSEKVKAKMHKCRRLVVVFTPAYMTNEWCMYCFAEGLRKLLELNIEMIFLVSDVSIMRELETLKTLVGHVPKIFLSILPMAQDKSGQDPLIRKIRFYMPASKSGSSAERGMRAPMLSDAEDIDQRSIRGESDSYGGTKTYTFGKPVENHKDDLDMDDVIRTHDGQGLEYDEEDPSSIPVHQYKARKDFLRITMVDT